jgi:hypothetical protein
MEQKFIQFLLALNRINQKLKSISAEFDKLQTEFMNEDFDRLFLVDDMETVKTEDFE